MATEMRMLSFRIPESLRQDLDELAKASGEDVSVIIRRAIEQVVYGEHCDEPSDAAIDAACAASFDAVSGVVMQESRSILEIYREEGLL